MAKVDFRSVVILSRPTACDGNIVQGFGRSVGRIVAERSRPEQGASVLPPCFFFFFLPAVGHRTTIPQMQPVVGRGGPL